MALVDPKALNTPIAEAVLAENQNLALIFPVDIGKTPSSELYFFKVLRRFPAHWFYDLLPSIGAGGKLDFAYLGSTGHGSGDDILAIREERPFRILHLGVGVEPGGIRVYKAIPADVPQTGSGYETPTKIGDKFDFFDKTLSPFDAPTVASETVVYHKLSVHFGFLNTTTASQTPLLRIFGAGYDCVQITSMDIINRILAGNIPCRFLTIGGLALFTYVVPPDWKKGVILSEKELEKIMK